VDKTATINVVREYEMTNLLCTGCHTQSTPAVITEYDAGTHSHRACTDCHGDAPHNGDGANGCINCHDGGIVNGWAASAKASGNEHATGREACARCHQPDGEVSADNGFAAVGCRGCHNDEHTFDFSVAVEGCASCHNRDQATGGYHYETATRPAHGPDIVAKVAASKHLISTEEGHGSANCQRCHTLEGYLAFAASGSDFGGPDNGTGFVPVAGATINVSCAACHDPHTGDLRATPGWAIGSAQANVCTSCHNLVDASGTPIAAGLPVGPVGAEVTTLAKQQHGKDWYRNIASTHYDLPTTGVDLLLSDGVTAAPKTIEGYVVRLNADTACTDCHGHELRTNTNRVASATPTDATIHTDWAMSAHAGGLLKAKIAAFAAQGNPYNRNAVNAAAVMTAGVEDAPIGNAWAHYDWDSASRQACQHCHTATGAANFMDAAADEFATYDPTANDFSHLLDGQNELLYCWGCHSSVDSGALRATGAIPLDYTVDGAFPSLTAPDGNSAACLSCHSGRGNADSLLNGRTTATPDAITDYKIGGTSTHYFAAGATIYQVETKVGYTFGLPAASYANPSYFAHNQVGCAECHMTSDNSHSFAVVAKDETTGAITQLLAANCVECHSGAHGAALVNEDGPLGTAAAAAAFLEEEAEGYHQALEVFGAALAAAGTTPDSGYPYFVVTDPIATPTLAEAVQNEGHSGAMHNYSYLHHEPGAYAHNRLYAKRLIYDSLDWLDNAVMDQSVVVDAVAYPHAATWLGATRP
jgi:predicted CXXCH cytochrome family protein